MNKILFITILFISFPNILSFHHNINPKKLTILNSKNNDAFKFNKEILNVEKFEFNIDDNLLKISERKHGQIAIISLISILTSEMLISNFLLEGKGINLIENSDILNYFPFIITLYTIYEISFKGIFPDLKVEENLINKEIFFGRLSMILITFIFLYEKNYEIPIISQDLKTIVGAIILYFKILFSLFN